MHRPVVLLAASCLQFVVWSSRSCCSCGRSSIWQCAVVWSSIQLYVGVCSKQYCSSSILQQQYIAVVCYAHFTVVFIYLLIPSSMQYDYSYSIKQHAVECSTSTSSMNEYIVAHFRSWQQQQYLLVCTHARAHYGYCSKQYARSMEYNTVVHRTSYIVHRTSLSYSTTRWCTVERIIQQYQQAGILQYVSIYLCLLVCIYVYMYVRMHVHCSPFW